MRHFFRILFCCFLSMVFILELSAWMLGFGVSWSMLIVSFVCLVVLMAYTVYDVLSVVDKYKRCKKKIDELEENYDCVCEEIKHLKDYVKEDSLEISRLRKLLYY